MRTSRVKTKINKDVDSKRSSVVKERRSWGMGARASACARQWADGEPEEH